MLVPQFRLTQDQNHLIVTIRLPYVKITKAEFYISADSFKFFLKPYLLSISLAHIPQNRLKQTQQPSRAKYDYDKHLLAVWLAKQVPGTQFEGLDLLTKMLAPSKKKDSSEKQAKNKQKFKKSMVEVLHSQEDTSTKAVQFYKGEDINEFSYGFNNNYDHIFDDLDEQACELFGFNPQQVRLSQRELLDTQIVNQDFDSDNYLFDFLENQQIESVMQVKFKTQGFSLTLENGEPMSRKDFLQLLKLPSKQILISESNVLPTLYQISTILFAYIYEWHCMGGETSSESAVSIGRSCPVLSCNITYANAKKAMVGVYRRCMTYSLYRHFGLAELVRQELSSVFCEREAALKILLELRRLFESSQPRYLLNRIYLDDMSLFIQEVSPELLEQVAKELGQPGLVVKNDLELALLELQECAEESEQQSTEN